MELEELEEIIQENYALFFGSLLLRVGTANGKTKKKKKDQEKCQNCQTTTKKKKYLIKV